MGYLVIPGVIFVLAMSAAVWYYRRRAVDAEGRLRGADDQLAVAAAEDDSRRAAEEARNTALVDSWKAGMDSAGKNEDAEKALDVWRSAAGRVRKSGGDR